MGIIGAVIAVVGLAVSASASRSAGKARKKAAKEQQRQARAETLRSKRRVLREAALRRGQVTNVAGLTGTLGSSGAEGAVSSIATQVGTNLSFLDQTFGRSENISAFLSRAASKERLAQTAQQVSSFAMSAGGQTVGGGFRSIFTSPGQSAAPITTSTPIGG